MQHVSTLPLKDYVNLLRYSNFLIGNSSSGIHESATFGVPTINVGSRQNRRLRSDNVIDVDYDKNEIKAAIERCLTSKRFIEKCRTSINLYGDGKSSKKIIDLLKQIDISDRIIQKEITY
jgi:UDP-N-acetylglucosamine 2-epimerase